MKCDKCGYDDLGTGDSAHFCPGTDCSDTQNYLRRMRQENITLVGEKADGSRDTLGEVPMPPQWKMRDIARSYFGESSGEGDEADMCLGALEEFHAWLIAQGWNPPQPPPPPMTLMPNIIVTGTSAPAVEE